MLLINITHIHRAFNDVANLGTVELFNFHVPCRIGLTFDRSDREKKEE